jgi:GR25 family glycosyltransferase involved in LPS biosynthesis
MGMSDMRAYAMNLESRPDRMVDFQKNIFPFEVKRFNAIKTDPGWKGCTESQLTILALQDEFPFIIFEDDCVLLQPWSIVEKAMEQLPENWDLLYLGATLMQPIEKFSENLFCLKKAYCAHAIIYNSKRVVDYILNNHVRFFQSSSERNTLDVFYFNEIQEKFNCYIVSPLIATQRPGFSDIENMNVDYTQIINHFNIYTDASK